VKALIGVMMCMGVAMALNVWAEGAEVYPLRDAVECRPRGGLPNVFVKLQAGKEVRIAYLGGSITAQNGWRPKTLAWFQKQFPRAKVSQINAAIGGTGSDLGVFRLQHDVLQYKPDLLFVEFAVNDGGAPPSRIHKSMEGIVRQTWRANPETDICFVYTLTQGMLPNLQSGKFPRAASAMEAVADHYGIPSIHMGMEVAKLEKEGKLIFRGALPKTEAEKKALNGKIVFSPDGVHPYPQTGHEIYLKVVARSMEKIRSVGKPGPHKLPAPLDPDNWEDAKMIPLDQVHLSKGWKKLDPATNQLAKLFANRLPGLWEASQPDESMSFRFKGKYVAVYDLLGPDCGQIIILLDAKTSTTRARFDGYCSYYRLATLPVGSGLRDGVHVVLLKIDSKQPDRARILQKPRLPDLKAHPEKYDGVNWIAGAILLRGELVK